jgi:hypothetical protein
MAEFQWHQNPRILVGADVSTWMRDTGRFLIIIGVVTAILGVILWAGFAPKWLGRLPGDIRIDRGNFGLYFPIVTCIVISIVLTLIFSLFRR